MSIMELRLSQWKKQAKERYELSASKELHPWEPDYDDLLTQYIIKSPTAGFLVEFCLYIQGKRLPHGRFCAKCNEIRSLRKKARIAANVERFNIPHPWEEGCDFSLRDKFSLASRYEYDENKRLRKTARHAFPVSWIGIPPIVLLARLIQGTERLPHRTNCVKCNEIRELRKKAKKV